MDPRVSCLGPAQARPSISDLATLLSSADQPMLPSPRISVPAGA